MKPRVYVVYCVDTEGPLHEPLEATFGRLEEYFGLTLTPSEETLAALQNGHFPEELAARIEGREKGLMDMISPARLNYSSDWTILENRINRCFDDEIRLALPDAEEKPLQYSWFAVDRVGVDDNPRRRALGFHQVYDFYDLKIRGQPEYSDEIYWHFHTVPFSKQAHRCATALYYSNAHYEILSRRLIDRGSFPVAFRPGCDVERADVNLFLEQWIPFDYANMAGERSESERQQPDATGTRFHDWRFAPRRWGAYHPDVYDVQKEGPLARYIARCRYVEGRFYQITQGEVDEAFGEARNEGAALLAVMSHDTRDLPGETLKFLEMLRDASRRFDDVEFVYCNARRGVQRYASLSAERAPQLVARFEGNRLIVETSTDIWGSQPFLAFKTLTNQYFHDNFTRVDETTFAYTFDEMSTKAEALEVVGVAAHNRDGNTAVCRLIVGTPRFDPGRVEQIHG